MRPVTIRGGGSLRLGVWFQYEPSDASHEDDTHFLSTKNTAFMSPGPTFIVEHCGWA